MTIAAISRDLVKENNELTVGDELDCTSPGIVLMATNF